MSDNKIMKSEFSKSLGTIFVGIIMTTLNIQLWKLNYILPLVGYILLFVELKSLKDENKYFKLCFVFTMIRFLIYFKTLLLDATLLPSLYPLYFKYINGFFVILEIVFLILFLLNFKKAMFAIQEKSKTKYQIKSIQYLIVCYLIFSFIPIAFMHFMTVNITSTSIFLALMLTGFIIVIVLFIKLHKELAPFHNLGDFVSINKGKKSYKFYGILIVSFVLISVLVAHTYLDVYPMTWTERKVQESEAIKQEKRELIAKGFPEIVLKDISEEDILECKDALKVVYEVSKDEDVYFMDKGQLKMYSIIVQLPSTKEDTFKYKVFHYFTWDKSKGCFGTECLVGIPNENNRVKISDASGRLLSSNENKSYMAPYYSLEKIDYTKDDTLHKNSLVYNDLYLGTFSLEKHQESSGYLSYLAEDSDSETDYFESCAAYLYQQSFFQYPVISAKQSYLSATLYDNNYNFLYLRVKIKKDSI